MSGIPATPRTPARAVSRTRRTAPRIQSPTSVAILTPKSAGRSKAPANNALRNKSGKGLTKRNTNEIDNYIKIQTSREAAEVIALLRAAQEMKVMEVQEASSLTKVQFNDLMRLHVPVIFRGYASDWNCVKNWSQLEYLKAAAEEERRDIPKRKYRQFTAQTDEAGRLHLTDGKAKAKPVTLEEFLLDAELDKKVLGQYLLGIHSVGNASSLLYCPVQVHAEDEGRIPPLSRDVPRSIDLVNWYGMYLAGLKGANETIPYDHQQFFLARGYAFTDLHYDTYDNFYVAASGTRRWTLACPNASRWLIGPAAGKLKSGSQMIPHQDKFPPGSPAQIYPFAFVDLKPGDVLFVPSCWWHLVESIPGDEGYSSAFNFFFSNPPDEVYERFLHDLDDTETAVSEIQAECRLASAKAARMNEASSSSLASIPQKAPERISQALWDQLLGLVKVHNIASELEKLHASQLANAISPFRLNSESCNSPESKLVDESKLNKGNTGRRKSMVPAVSG